MKKIVFNQSKITDNCGKKGCKLFVMPYASTKEAFQKFVDFCVEDQKQEETKIKEI